MAAPSMSVFSKFESELAVRPDDIDLYQHVHALSRLRARGALLSRWKSSTACRCRPLPNSASAVYDGGCDPQTPSRFGRPHDGADLD